MSPKIAIYMMHSQQLAKSSVGIKFQTKEVFRLSRPAEPVRTFRGHPCYFSKKEVQYYKIFMNYA